MAHRVSAFLPLAAVLAVAAPPAAQAGDRPDYNRTMASMHEPIVSRTDYAFDAIVGPAGLATGEPQRLAGWFDSLGLGYGDTVTIDNPAGWTGDRTADSVGAVLSRYGMLVSAEAAPATAGRPPAGSVRVVVSRAVARVDGCPDWSRGNMGEFEGANTSNYGCTTASNLAAMIADPQDLVRGAQAGPAVDARLSVKAVGAWRDAAPTGAGGLKTESSKGGK